MKFVSFLGKWYVCSVRCLFEYFGYKCVFEMFSVEHSDMGHLATGYVVFGIPILCQSPSYRGKGMIMYPARYMLCSVWWRSTPFCFYLLWSYWVLNYCLKIFWTTLCKSFGIYSENSSVFILKMLWKLFLKILRVFNFRNTLLFISKNTLM